MIQVAGPELDDVVDEPDGHVVVFVAVAVAVADETDRYQWGQKNDKRLRAGTGQSARCMTWVYSASTYDMSLKDCESDVTRQQC